MLKRVNKAVQITNPDYDVIKKLYIMTPVIFGIDEEINVIAEFPVFMQSYIRYQLILYQIETVPVL